MPTIVSSASAAATTVTMPTHAAGDIILVYTVNNAGGSGSEATVPTGAGTDWQNMNSSASSSFGGDQLYGKIATSSSHTTGTWTSATGIAVIVVRGSSGLGTGSSISNSSSGSTTVITYPALTLLKTDSTSDVLRIATPGTGGSTITSGTPSGYTAITGVGNQMQVSIKSGVNSNPTADDQTTSTAGNWISHTIELSGAPSGTNLSDSFTGTNGDPANPSWWQTVTGGPAINIQSNALKFVGGYFGSGFITSVDTFNFVSGSAVFHNNALNSGSTVFGMMQLGIGGTLSAPAQLTGYAVSINSAGTTATAQTVTNSVLTTVGSTRTNTVGDWYRIRESGGTVYWETSTNGTSWSSWQSQSGTVLSMRIAMLPVALGNGSTINFDDVSATNGVATPTNLFFQLF